MRRKVLAKVRKVHQLCKNSRHKRLDCNGVMRVPIAGNALITRIGGFGASAPQLNREDMKNRADK